MRLISIAAISASLCFALAAALPQEPKEKPAAPAKLSDEWTKVVTVDDLTTELSYVVTNSLAQNLKKQGDYDKFVKKINEDGHLAAMLAALVAAHPDAGNWKGVATQVQAQAVELATAAENKGKKNFDTASAAYKKMTDLIAKGKKGDKVDAPGGDSTDWPSLGELKHMMKRVDVCDKQLRGPTANADAFKKGAEKLRHEAALLAAFSDVSPGFRPGEKAFETNAAKMSVASREIAAAAKDGDYEKANKAYTVIKQACNDCHKAYRFESKSTDF